MLRELKIEETITTRKFGGFCPIWTRHQGKTYVSDTMEEMLNFLPKKDRVIDPSALLSLLSNLYINGDRTIIEGVYRMPWHSTLTSEGKIIRDAPLPHSNNILSSDDASDQLIKLLEEEIIAVTKDKDTIYLLLTGGYDSRIIAGILKRIESEINKPIIAVTWGQENSRDINYASRIAGWFDWEIIKIPYNSNLVKDNLERSAIWGVSEVSGLHLHGMNWFSKIKKNDLALAASFGDGIGRAEFSSSHLADLNLPKIYNPSNLFQPSIYRKNVKTVLKDRSLAWDSEPSDLPWVKNELDRQENYMRRMLCHSMDYISQYSHLYQAFSSDKVVSFMWSLDVSVRNNYIYRKTLEKLDIRLYHLAWSRNGKSFEGVEDSKTELTKDYHDIYNWIRNELKEDLEKLVFSGKLKDLNIFSNKNLKSFYHNIKSGTQLSRQDIEVFYLLAGIAKSCEHFELVSPIKKPSITYHIENFIFSIFSKFDSVINRIKSVF